MVIAGCGDHTKGKPQAEVRDAQAAPTKADPSDTSAARKSLRFSQDGSAIEFVGAKVTGKHDCSFERFTGTIDLVDGDPTKSVVRVEIDMTSVETDAPKLTGHLKSDDFFDVETHPTSTFESTKIEADAKGPNAYTVTGNLDLHGVKRSITFPATIDAQGEKVTVAAEFALDRQQFEIKYAGAPDDLIKDDVLMVLKIAAKA